MTIFQSLGGARPVSTLAAVCLAALVLPLSFTSGAVATPAISQALGGSPFALAWITNAFMLTFGSLLMAAGALADQYGRKRQFAIGLFMFVLVSLALCFAPSVLWIDLLRGLQGVAAAAAFAGGAAALAQEFDGHGRMRAFSLLGTTFGLGLAFGPLLAGFLIEHFGWHAVFMTTALLGSLALICGLPYMHESRDPDARGLDWWGTLTFSGSLTIFTFVVIQAPVTGWLSSTNLMFFCLALALLLAFVVAEFRVARPMLDLSLFRYPRFVGVQMLPVGTCFCYIVLVVLLPLRLIGVGGMSAVACGMLMLAMSVPMLIVPSIVATLARRVSPGALSGIGFLIAACGLNWLRFVDLTQGGWDAMLPLLLIGIGTGMPWGLMDGLSMSVVPKARAGMATGIFNTTRVAGECISLAAVTAVLATSIQTRLRGAIGAANADAQGIADAAQRLAVGDLANAQGILHGLGRPLLVQSYVDSFNDLLLILVGITLLAAVAAFLVLGKGGADASGIVAEGADL